MENNIHTHTYIYIYIYVHIYKHEHTFIVAMVFVNCWFINGILDQNMHLIAYVRAQLEKWKINLLPWADDRLNPVTKVWTLQVWSAARRHRTQWGGWWRVPCANGFVMSSSKSVVFIRDTTMFSPHSKTLVHVMLDWTRWCCLAPCLSIKMVGQTRCPSFNHLQL